MANNLADDQLQEVLDAYKKFNGNKTHASEYLSMCRRTFGHRYKVAIERFKYGVEEGQSLKGVSIYEKKNPATGEWEERNRWVKTDVEKEDFYNSIQEMLESAKENLPRSKNVKAPKNYHNNIATVIPIGDAHIGMYAWKEESGAEWDLDIALKEMCATFDYLVGKASPSERCIILNVGDYFHYSKMEPTTEKSNNVLDAAGRPQSMFDVGLKIMRYAIDVNLKKHSVVEIANASGNHDGLLAFVLSTCLANIYENEPRVIIHTNPTMRHYIKYGTNLIGLVHGHRTKDSELPLIMANEMPSDWGESKHRIWFRGHHHHDSKIEYHGCYVEQVRTLAPKDAYAAGGGYLSGRDMKQIYFHKEYGRQGQDTCTPEMLREMIK